MTTIATTTGTTTIRQGRRFLQLRKCSSSKRSHPFWQRQLGRPLRLPTEHSQRYVRIRSYLYFLVVVFMLSTFMLHDHRGSSRSQHHDVGGGGNSMNLTNLLWSRNWHHLATCHTVPTKYYTLEDVKKWCKLQYTTECTFPAAELVEWFSSCSGGRFWVRLQSHGQLGRGGDVTTFIRHVLPLMNRTFELITTDGDNNVPSQIPLANELLESPLLKTWYTQNYDGTSDHPKLRPIPIGLDMHTKRDGLWSDYAQVNLHHMKLIRRKAYETNGNRSEVWIPPMSFNSIERVLAVTAAKCLNHKTSPSMKTSELYETYAKYRFGLSPEGNGQDTHRTWEMLFFGQIPIVKTGPLDPLYTDLPVLIVNNWGDICRKGFLEEAYTNITRKHMISMDDSKLTMAYYIGLAERQSQANRNKTPGIMGDP